MCIELEDGSVSESDFVFLTGVFKTKKWKILSLKRSLSVLKTKWHSTFYYADSSEDDDDLQTVRRKPFTFNTILGVSTSGVTSSTVTALPDVDVSNSSTPPIFLFNDCPSTNDDGGLDVLENLDFLNPQFFGTWNEDHGLGADGVPVEARVRTLEVCLVLMMSSSVSLIYCICLG
jgi:hypothetical protein